MCTAEAVVGNRWANDFQKKRDLHLGLTTNLDSSVFLKLAYGSETDPHFHLAQENLDDCRMGILEMLTQ